MINLNLKIRSIIVGLVVLIFVTTQFAISAFAQAEEESVFSQKITSVEKFFGSAIDPVNFFAPFDDLFFTQNRCQKIDIFALTQERDNVGLLIRKVLLDDSVSLEDFKKLENKYDILSAEIFYLRNIDLLIEDQLAILNSETLKAFDDRRLIADQLADFEKKYRKNLTKYSECHTTFSELKTAWGRIVADTKGAGSNFINASKNLRNTFVETPGILLDNTLGTLEGFYEAVVGVPSLFTSKEEASVGANNVILSRVLEGGASDIFAKTQQKNRSKAIEDGTGVSVYYDNRASQLLNQNPNASLLDLVQQSVEYEGEVGAILNQQVTENNLQIKAASLDGSLLNAWGASANTSIQFERYNQLLNPKGSQNLSIGRQLDDLAKRQCREKV